LEGAGHRDINLLFHAAKTTAPTAIGRLSDGGGRLQKDGVASLQNVAPGSALQAARQRGRVAKTL
jgi:hypothetical protein